jgi:hypothetical protein
MREWVAESRSEFMPSKPLVNGTKSNGTLNWVPVLGQWDISAESQKFLGEGPKAATQAQSFPLGLAVSSLSMQTGQCGVHIQFSSAFDGKEQAAGIVLGYRSPEQPYIIAEIGASAGAYSIIEYVSNFGWRPLAATGLSQNLQMNREYLLEVNLSGQELRVFVDEVPILQHLLSHPLEGRQVGLIATGNHEVSFSQFAYKGSRPKAFVVMQFAEPYDTFYKEVIQKQAEVAGFDVFRIDEKAGPGVIFQDIQREIEQAEVVIAEITPANPNVFYEVGYAHALGKPTILLAQRGAQLPFDIRSFRVVFYNDTIGGKAEVERNLSKHLEAIAGR